MEPLDPRDLRISDLDRHRVAEVLRVAAGDGRLDAEELDERLEATYAARTFADLVPLTEDLPGHVDLTPPAPFRPPPPLPRGPVPRASSVPMPPSRTLEETLGSLWPGASAPPPAPWPTQPTEPWTPRPGPTGGPVAPPPAAPPPAEPPPPAPATSSTSSPTPSSTWAVASDAHRGAGRWSPGPRQTVVAVMGSAHLDLRHADLPPVLEVRARAVMGDVVVLVPADVRLDVAGVPVLGSCGTDEARGGGPVPVDPAAPLVRVRGVALLGHVVVRRAAPDDLADD